MSLKWRVWSVFEMDCIDETREIEFNPPLYIQRYDFVCDILKDRDEENEIKSVVDLGCAECSLINRMKMLDSLEVITGVDIDGNLLESCKQRTAPLGCDYIVKRKRPLTISLYRGSVAEVDARLGGYDAVSCIELIEHLLPDVLAKLPRTVFSHIQPKIAVFSTPNREFNVLFPNLTTFRHWDHKFEWTRDEFKQWCDEIIEKYPNYSYFVSGVGEGPEGWGHLGFCSQIAIFRREELEECGDKIDDTPYDLIVKHDYPQERKNCSEKEILLMEAEYYIRLLATNPQDGEDVLEDGSQTLVPLGKVLGFKKVKNLCPNEEDLKRVLEEAGRTVETKNGLFYVIHLEEEREDEDYY